MLCGVRKYFSALRSLVAMNLPNLSIFTYLYNFARCRVLAVMMCAWRFVRCHAIAGDERGRRGLAPKFSYSFMHRMLPPLYVQYAYIIMYCCTGTQYSA